jgi:hypothetical protein
LLPPALIPRNQKQVEAKERAKEKAKDKDKDKTKDKDKDNDKEEEEEVDSEEEEEVTNLLPTTANTANINNPLSGSTTVEEKAAEVDPAAPMPSVKRATAPTPATALTLATPALARWAILSMRTSTTEGLRETRPGKWDPHSHVPGRWQHYQQHQQQFCCQRVEDYPGHLVLWRGTSRRRPTPSTSDRGRKS